MSLAPSLPLLSPTQKPLAAWLQHTLVARMRQDIKSFYRTARAGEKSGYHSVKTPVTALDLHRHLTGEQPLGLYLQAPEADGQVQVAVVDIDDKRRELTWPELCAVGHRFQGALEARGLLPLIVSSGSGHGLHLWLLWDRPQLAAAVRAELKLVHDLVAPSGHVDLFPKQDRLAGSLGNLVALPFSRRSRPVNLATGELHEDLNTWPLLEPGLSRPLKIILPGASSGLSAGSSAPLGGEDPVVDWLSGDKVRDDEGRGLAGAEDAIAYGPVDPEYLLTAIKHVVAADYQTWMKYGLGLKVAVSQGQLTDDQGFWVWTEWARSCAEKYNASEHEQEWRRFRPRGAGAGAVTLGTLWWEAKEAGWVPEVKAPPAPLTMAELLEMKNLAKKDVVGSVESNVVAGPFDPEFNMADSMVQVELEDNSLDPLLRRELMWRGGGGGPDVDDVNRNHFVARDGGKVHLFIEEQDSELRRKILTKISINDFKVIYQNQLVQAGSTRSGLPTYKPLGEVWLNSPFRRQYRQIVLEPDERACKPWQYNLWQGWSVTPSTEGSWDLLNAHVFNNICRQDPIAHEYLLNWMAFTFQNPTKPIGTALVIRGNKGTGKSAFVRAFGGLFAKHFLQITNSKAIIGNFNSHLRSCILLFADEAVWAGSRAEESTLKAYITEPTLMIEGKGRDAITCRNMMHVVIATNHDWAVPASMDERRFCCLNVSDAQQQNRPYFVAIQRQLVTGGSARLLHDMLTRDISKFDPQSVPSTDELTEQKLLSLDTQGKWWWHRLEEGTLCVGCEYWEQEIPAEVVYQDYVSFCKDLGERRVLGAPEVLSKWLESLTGQRIISAKKRVSIIGGEIRVRTVWLFPPLGECRLAFNKKLKSKILWNIWPEPEPKVNKRSEDDEVLKF